MKFLKITFLSVLVLCFATAKSQRPFFLDGFEGQDALKYYTVIDANSDVYVTGRLNFWETSGTYALSSISDGYSHSSLKTPYIHSK